MKIFNKKPSLHLLKAIEMEKTEAFLQGKREVKKQLANTLTEAIEGEKKHTGMDKIFLRVHNKALQQAQDIIRKELSK